MAEKETIILTKIIISPLLKAKKSFDDVLNQPKNECLRDAAIQRFEYTFELSWKTLKKIINYLGHNANSPRAIIREAAKEGLINNPKIWFDFLEYSNQTSHTYNESIAEEIYSNLPKFQTLLQHMIEEITKL